MRSLEICIFIRTVKVVVSTTNHRTALHGATFELTNATRPVGQPLPTVSAANLNFLFVLTIAIDRSNKDETKINHPQVRLIAGLENRGGDLSFRIMEAKRGQLVFL